MNDARSSTSTFRDAHTCPPRTRLKSQTRATRLKKRLTPCQSFESLIYRRDTIEGAPFFVQLWTTTRAARRWSGRSTTFGAINKIRFTCCASYRRDMKTRVTCIQWYVARASNSGRCVDWIQETDALVALVHIIDGNADKGVLRKTRRGDGTQKTIRPRQGETFYTSAIRSQAFATRHSILD